LTGLTVLIGPNGSGKSNFLDVFALLASSSVGRLSDGIAKRGGINTLLFRGHDKIFLSFEFAPEGDFLNEKGPLNYKLLESAATRTQVIVTTHSPELVSHIKPHHVVVVEKEEGATTLSRLTEDELADWLDKFRLGDLWLAGHIGGRP